MYGEFVECWGLLSGEGKAPNMGPYLPIKIDQITMKLGKQCKENGRLSKSSKVNLEVHQGGNHPSELQIKEPLENPQKISHYPQT